MPLLSAKKPSASKLVQKLEESDDPFMQGVTHNDESSDPFDLNAVCFRLVQCQQVSLSVSGDAPVHIQR